MESFNNYNLILLREKIRREKKLRAEGKLLKSNLKIDNENCDIIVKIDNKNMGKTLIFSGKLTELYIKNLLNYNNNNNNILSSINNNNLLINSKSNSFKTNSILLVKKNKKQNIFLLLNLINFICIYFNYE